MINKEHASSKKNGTKFDIIQTMAYIEQEMKPGSSLHYDSMLKKRQSGKVVIRPRGEDEEDQTPFDDEGQVSDPEIHMDNENELDGMSISNFSKKYLSQSSHSPFNAAA